ncbi:MAG: hypothetical protein VX438_12945, partial [Planctomycetota bacterium]|nr:hypothetical protein [Planctomycetota bacterium]
PGYLKQAQAISDELLKSDPDNPGYRLLHAKLHRTRALMFGVDGKKEWQVELLKNSITELETLVTDYPENPEYRFSLVLTQMIRVRNVPLDNHFGMVTRAEEICSGLVADHPSVLEYLDLYFSITQKLGRIYFNKKDYRQSIKMYEKSKSALLRLIEKSPTVLGYYSQYVNNADGIVECHIRSQNLPAAREELRGIIGFVETSLVFNGTRLKKKEFLDKAVRRLRSLRSEQ